MRAMVFEGVGRPLRAVDLELPAPVDGHLLLRVEACGICRTDLHLLDGEVPIDEPPRVLGTRSSALDAIPDSIEAREQGQATLNRVARRLQHLDWRSIAPVSDDFVVLAVDLELPHLEDNLRFSVPAKLRRRLAGQGLL